MGTGYSIRARGKAEAEIYIYEDIGSGFFTDGVTAKGFADDLKALGKIETINLRINSAGGDVFDGLAIYNLLSAHDARVIAHVDGISASIASVITMSGDEIRIAENGFIMIHDAWSVASGNARELREMADKLEMVSASIADVYVARTGAKIDQVRAWMDAETWFSAEDAVKNGFATMVTENQRVAAKLDPAKHKFRNTPCALVAPVPDAMAQIKPKYAAQADALRKLGMRFELGNSRSG